MGTVFATIEVGDLQGRNFQRVEVEVDTGSTYTALPREMLQALGVAAERTIASRLADGSEKPVQVGYANVRLEGTELITPAGPTHSKFRVLIESWCKARQRYRL